MPRKFTSEERTKITHALVDAARECFGQYGIKKTTIRDLTDRAGIAVGSFYDFFSSKEELYIELIAEEVPAGVQRIIDASLLTTDDTRHALVLLMKAAADEMVSNPLASVLLDNPQELQAILSTVDYAKLMKRIGGAYDPLIDYIRERQNRGEIVGGDPYEVWYCMGMVKFLPVNKRNFPPSIYESLMRQFPEVIANGLIRTKSNTREE